MIKLTLKDGSIRELEAPTAEQIYSRHKKSYKNAETAYAI